MSVDSSKCLLCFLTAGISDFTVDLFSIIFSLKFSCFRCIFQFNIVLLLFLLAEIGALILAFVFTSDIENVLGTAALTSIRTHYGVSSSIGLTATKIWDFTQIAVSFAVK